MSVIPGFSLLPSVEKEGWDVDRQLEARPSQQFFLTVCPSMTRGGMGSAGSHRHNIYAKRHIQSSEGMA